MFCERKNNFLIYIKLFKKEIRVNLVVSSMLHRCSLMIANTRAIHLRRHNQQKIASKESTFHTTSNKLESVYAQNCREKIHANTS